MIDQSKKMCRELFVQNSIKGCIHQRQKRALAQYHFCFSGYFLNFDQVNLSFPKKLRLELPHWLDKMPEEQTKFKHSLTCWPNLAFEYRATKVYISLPQIAKQQFSCNYINEDWKSIISCFRWKTLENIIGCYNVTSTTIYFFITINVGITILKMSVCPISQTQIAFS